MNAAPDSTIYCLLVLYYLIHCRVLKRSKKKVMCTCVQHFAGCVVQRHFTVCVIVVVLTFGLMIWLLLTCNDPGWWHTAQQNCVVLIKATINLRVDMIMILKEKSVNHC